MNSLMRQPEAFSALSAQVNASNRGVLAAAATGLSEDRKSTRLNSSH